MSGGIWVAIGVVGMAIGAGHSQRARQVAWTAAALATAVLGALGLVVAVAPAVWTTLFTQEAAVLQSSASYFLWAGPCYGLFGLGLSLYFSSLGAGKATGPVLAGALRLAVVAAGGAWLAHGDSPAWMIFALVGLGMAAYGFSTALFVKVTPWGEQ
jgi:Na+-driven multidrug efflux pump